MNYQEINKQFFFCYDANLSHFLKFDKKIDYITKAINPNSQRMFWMYQNTEDVNKGISEFFGE